LPKLESFRPPCRVRPHLRVSKPRTKATFRRLFLRANSGSPEGRPRFCGRTGPVFLARCPLKGVPRVPPPIVPGSGAGVQPAANGSDGSSRSGTQFRARTFVHLIVVPQRNRVSGTWHDIWPPPISSPNRSRARGGGRSFGHGTSL
jgi:hypothetical protein